VVLNSSRSTLRFGLYKFADGHSDHASGYCTTNPTAISVVANGRVERIVITNQGVGCTTNSFNVTLSAPAAGTTATALVTGASGGKVTRISMLQKGSGYAAPVVAITGGGGSGATAGVNVAGGGLQGVYLLEPGDGRYTSQPTVTLTGDTGTGADATVALPDVIVSELDTDGNCTVTYDPEDHKREPSRWKTLYSSDAVYLAGNANHRGLT
jgi:hypothetical protein